MSHLTVSNYRLEMWADSNGAIFTVIEQDGRKHFQSPWESRGGGWQPLASWLSVMLGLHVDRVRVVE